MSTRRVSFSPDVNGRPPAFNKHCVGGGTKKRMVGIWTFRASKNSGFSAMRFLERIGAKVARALGFVSMNGIGRYSSSSPSSSSSCSLARSRSYNYAETLDSHRAEAIQDCIQFLNSSSSSSFKRSKSLSTCSY